MKGLELSRGYYEDIVRPAIEEKFGDKIDRMAFGLVGDGSECYGFDDEISQDHDFGPRVQIWLTAEDFEEFGRDLQKFMETVTKEYKGYQGVNMSQYGDGREGVFTVGGFYARFIGLDRVPATIQEWRMIPEVNLSIATNGEVFSDELGRFTKFRKILQRQYPEELRLKKMAARCMSMAQSGQYNYTRCMRRGEYVAAWMAASEFMKDACSMVHLINHKYCPFYKWAHRSLKTLPILGEEVAMYMDGFISASEVRASAQIIEKISEVIIEQLKKEGLTSSNSDFLLDHGPEIQSRIKDDTLRRLPLWSE